MERFSSVLNRILMGIGGFFLAALVILTCANIFLRAVWVPVRGTFELMGFFGAVVTAFALGHTQRSKGHIAVDILLNAFAPNIRRVLMIFSYGLCAVFAGLAAWQVTVKAMVLLRTGEVTETLRMIYYPFTFAVALGCLVLAVSLVVDVIVLIRAKKEE
jgi:TRAP-type C4-dicarboxylate transport system permease small subunit